RSFAAQSQNANRCLTSQNRVNMLVGKVDLQVASFDGLLRLPHLGYFVKGSLYGHVEVDGFRHLNRLVEEIQPHLSSQFSLTWIHQATKLVFLVSDRLFGQ